MPEVEAPFVRRLTELRSVRGVAAPRRAHVIDAVTKGTLPLTSDVAHAKAPVCSQCGQVGHIAQVCRSKGRFWKTGESRARDRVRQLSEDKGQGSEGEYELRWIRAREGRSISSEFVWGYCIQRLEGSQP